MEVHILVPTHKRPELLRRFLTSMVPIIEEVPGAIIHVIENGGQGSQAIVNEFTHQLTLRHYQLRQGNKSLALNHVIRQIPKDAFFLFFDDDIAVQPGTLHAFLAAATTFGPGHYFGGAQHPVYELLPEKKMLPYLPPSSRKFDLSRGEQYRRFSKFQFFIGSVWACFASDLDDVDNFNENFGPGAPSGARGQETDAQLRLFQAGVFPVFVRDAVVDNAVSPGMVSADYAVNRIFLSSIHRGVERPSVLHTLGMLTKLTYSSLLLPWNSRSVGHRYRIAKAAGYFQGVVTRNRSSLKKKGAAFVEGACADCSGGVYADRSGGAGAKKVYAARAEEDNTAPAPP